MTTTGGEIEFNIIARDNASHVFRRIRREALATSFVVGHPLLLLSLLLLSTLSCGILIGLLVA